MKQNSKITYLSAGEIQDVAFIAYSRALLKYHGKLEYKRIEPLMGAINEFLELAKYKNNRPKIDIKANRIINVLDNAKVTMTIDTTLLALYFLHVTLTPNERENVYQGVDLKEFYTKIEPTLDELLGWYEEIEDETIMADTYKLSCYVVKELGR